MGKMNEEIIWDMVDNNECPSEILIEVLAKGTDDWISRYAAMNPNCPPEALQMVLERGKNNWVSHNAARNHNCPSQARLKWLMAVGKIKTPDLSKHDMQVIKNYNKPDEEWEQFKKMVEGRKTSFKKTSQRGEWWFIDGQAFFADADIGDYNHSGVVIEHILAINDIPENIDIENLTPEQKEKLTPEELDVLNNQVDPREYGMKHLGWQRVKQDNIQTETLTTEDLKNITNGLFDAYEDEIENDPNATFNIEVNAAREIYEDVPWFVLEKESPTDLLPYRRKISYANNNLFGKNITNWYKKAQENSDKFEWHYDASEIFEFVMRRYDIREAKKIIQEKPRKIHNMSLEGLKSMIPKRPKPIEGGRFEMHPGIGVNWGKIDTEEINLNFPVIVATRKDNSLLPIDGWHRMAKAMDKGITSLPAVLLTKKETKQIEY